MANADNARGLQVIRHRNGAPFNGSGSLYHVAATHAGEIAPGDPVTVTGTADSTGIAGIDIATAGATEQVTGAVIAITNGEGTVTQDSPQVLPALTEGYILVADDPDLVFEIQMSAAFVANDVSNNANLLAGAASANQSGWQVNSTGIAGTATLQVKILRLVRRVDNEVGANAKVEVMINTHSQAHNSVGV